MGSCTTPRPCCRMCRAWCRKRRPKPSQRHSERAHFSGLGLEQEKLAGKRVGKQGGQSDERQQNDRRRHRELYTGRALGGGVLCPDVSRCAGRAKSADGPARPSTAEPSETVELEPGSRS